MEISVVIPVRNEQNSIPFVLEALLHQTLKPKEIIVVDGGSVDGTVEIVQRFIDGGAPIRLIREQAALPGRGRNVGAEHSSCEWIAFIDAGNTAAPDWLEALANRADEGAKTDVVYGSFDPVVDTFFKECAAIAYLHPPEDVDGIPTREPFIASTMLKRTVWATVGGFPEHLRSAEDLLFMEGIDRHGFTSVRAPKAIVRWDLQPDLWRTFKRFAVYARNNIRAGLWRQWQAAIFRRYAVILIVAIPAIFLGPRWLIYPLAVWLLFLTGRAVNAIRKHRFSARATLGRNIARLFLVTPIIAAVDLATFVGSFNWLLFDKLLRIGARSNDVPR